MNIELTVTDKQHFSYAEEICDLMENAAKKRGTGIAKRAPEYIREKMKEGKGVIAVDSSNGRLAGFCYIENWGHDNYIANSGLIVHPHYRKLGLEEKSRSASFSSPARSIPTPKFSASLPAWR